MAKTVGLAMIARDNAHCLPRCLASVEGLISSAVVVDTGSTDGTQDVARELGATVHEREWVDFGHNRTELMELARGTADYLLLLDADETIEQVAELPDLVASVYNLWMVDGTLRWRLPRLVHGDLDWHYVGVRHEYLDGSLASDRQDLDEIQVIHHGDGWTWEKKLEQRDDVAALEQAVADDPADARAWFYLAWAYKDTGRVDEAIHAYRVRSKLGGWEDEVFYSLYEAGSLMCVHRDAREGIPLLLEAWRLQPHRAEPVRAIANVTTHIADRIPMPAGGLFLTASAYKT